MGHSVTLGCFLAPSRSQVLGMVWTWHLAEVLKTLLQQLEVPVQCVGRRSRLRSRTRSPQAGRNHHFRSCLLAGAIAVMCHSSQPRDSPETSVHRCGAGARLPARGIRSSSREKCVCRVMDYRHSSLAFSKNKFVSFKQGYSLKSY